MRRTQIGTREGAASKGLVAFSIMNYPIRTVCCCILNVQIEQGSSFVVFLFLDMVNTSEEHGKHRIHISDA
jgi:hypothetical protein